MLFSNGKKNNDRWVNPARGSGMHAIWPFFLSESELFSNSHMIVN